MKTNKVHERPNEDCEILFIEPIDEEEVESLEEKRERMLRKYDVLYGEDLSEYSFEGPSFGKDRAAELARKFYAAHLGNDYEDNYARGLAHKLLDFLEWTPRTEFTYGEVMARLDY